MCSVDCMDLIMRMYLGLTTPTDLEVENIVECIRYAEDNKVIYPLLTCLEEHGLLDHDLYRRKKVLSIRYRLLLDYLRDITEELYSRGIEHVYIKTFRSIENITEDADLLILDPGRYAEAVEIVARIVRHKTYKVGGRSASFKLKGVNAWIDVYHEPGLNHIVYYPRHLIDTITRRSIGVDGYSYELPTPSLEDDLGITIGHAIIKEHRIDLLEVFTLSSALGKGFDLGRFIEKIRCAGLRRSVNIYASIVYGLISRYSKYVDPKVINGLLHILEMTGGYTPLDVNAMPYRLSKSLFLHALTCLLKESGYARESFIIQVVSLTRSRRNLVQFIREGIIHLGWMR